MWDNTGGAITSPLSLHGCDGSEVYPKDQMWGWKLLLGSNLSQTSIKWVRISHATSYPGVNQRMQLHLREDTSPAYNLLQDRGEDPGVLFFFLLQEIDCVVIFPNSESESNNASALPGERNITLFTALLCPDTQLWKTARVTRRWDLAGQSDCNARRNYRSKATCRGSVAITEHRSPQPLHRCTGSKSPWMMLCRCRLL